MEPRHLLTAVGGPAKLARTLGYKTHSAVLKWRVIPPHHCPTIEREFGIPREKLRPDLFERPAPAREVV